jgi:hypothetical protein
MTDDALQGRIDADTAAAGRFRTLPEPDPVARTRTEELVDEVPDPDDRRLWWPAVQQALHDG